MLSTLILSIPMALLWMIFARQFSLEGFIIGYIFGIGVIITIRLNTSFDEDTTEPIKISRIPSQIIALLIYIARLSVNVVLSGLDVAGKVLQAEMPIKPGVHAISTQDSKNHSLISALSAHSITITPGELVIDYDEDEDGNTIMLVHTLDKEASNPDKLKRDQTKRLKLIRQILGHDIPQDISEEV